MSQDGRRPAGHGRCGGAAGSDRDWPGGPKCRRPTDALLVSELKLAERAEVLRRNLTVLRRTTTRLTTRLEELREHAQKLMEDVDRTELDVAMTMRPCSGSCRSVLPFSVGRPGTEEEEWEELSRRRKAAPPPGGVPRVRLQHVVVGQAPPPDYRTIPAVRRELLTRFEDIKQNRVVLVEVLHPES
ncbi:uncharacterized protein LOC130212247 isoform X2 [Pseudoliparis swirei]|uniref:uncharacterized protein LOC130212247 isoform X2 n=1 Tax=Pseudoliparis swirei TaxID=2059687 RepID=UPI0024BD847F|nr:uncharacterized protein LOC130212247 isoform X2 [Pseudoliparis swirei]